MVLSRSLSSSLAVFLVASQVLNAATNQSAPDFSLSRWNSQELARLDEYRGQVIVLDFFAYWCAPCRRASTELEEGIQQYYATKRGNAHGIPVRVLSLNIEKAFPNRTAAFIKKTGIREVLNDPDATVLARYGGIGIPYLVILDGTQSTTARPSFKIVYKNAGFEGTAKLRQIIDSIGTDADSVQPRASEPDLLALEQLEPPAGGIPKTHKIEADFESLWSSDILLTQSSIAYSQTRPSTQLNAGFSYGSVDFDYSPVPFDFLGRATDVGEDQFAAQVSWKARPIERVTGLASAGFYEGFTDYRSAWLAEYYRQQFATLPGYEGADPNGWNLSTGVRWEYMPSTGFLQLDLAYLRDNIAPGYEIDFTGLFRGRETLHTYAIGLSTENVLTPRIRALNEVHLLDTTERGLRMTYQSSINLALGERWVWRSYGGLTLEEPEYEAYFVGTTLEFELTPSLLVAVNGRFYKDSGEIENSLLFSAAAPDIHSYQAGLSLRWLMENSVFKFTAAPYFTRYAPTGLGTAFFRNLYQDRDWGIAQITYSINL